MSKAYLFIIQNRYLGLYLVVYRRGIDLKLIAIGRIIGVIALHIYAISTAILTRFLDDDITAGLKRCDVRPCLRVGHITTAQILAALAL